MIPKTKKLFISYRRKSSPFTLLLANKLSEKLNADIFIDFQSIDQADFETSILRHLKASDAFLLMVTEYTFAERIHRDDDWVRLEIRTALEMNIPIILVCENGLFPPSDLPDDIRGVRGKQGIRFYPEFFDAAVIKLVDFLGKVADVQLKTSHTKTQELPVPKEELEPVIATKSTKITLKNARDVLPQAISAYEDGDFARALFLFESLQEIQYKPKMVNIDSVVTQLYADYEYAEQKRHAQIDYDELAIFAQSKLTLAHALTAFEHWCKEYPDFVSELDTLNLVQQQSKRRIQSPPPPAQNLPNPVRASHGSPVERALEKARNFKGTRNTNWEPIIMPLGDIVPDTPILDMEMCLVPVGKFMMGSDDRSDDEKPAHEQIITKPYWIARYPVTNAQYRLAVESNAVEAPKNTEWYDDFQYQDAPVVYVDWFMSRQFALWAKCDLPSELLWEYAARGVESWIYPWGDKFGGNKLVYVDNRQGEYPHPVTLHPEGASWTGVMHMSGNVWEWQSSEYKTYPYVADDGRESDTRLKTNVRRMLRGGSWLSGFTSNLRSVYRYSRSPVLDYDSGGLRCFYW